MTIGRPAKSEGSRIEAITVSEGKPIASASALITDVLPVPGDPHSSTGTRTGDGQGQCFDDGCLIVHPTSLAVPGHGMLWRGQNHRS